MKKIVVIFDVDGTLFDTKRGIIQALNYVLRQYERIDILKEDEDKYIGPSIKDSLMMYQGFDETLAIEATKLYRQVYVEQFVTNSVLYDKMQMVLECLKKQNVILGIATMKTMPQVEKLLEVFEMQNYFDIVYAAKEDGSLSKKQMLFDIKAKLENYDAEFYMVGDTSGDYEAAIQAEYSFIVADYGYGNVKNVQGIHINQPSDILKEVIGEKYHRK